MKKSILVVLAVGIIAAIGVGAYAHGGGGYDQKGYGHMMGGMHGRGAMMGGRDAHDGQQHCGAWAGWNTPDQSETAPQVITEEKAKEVAETYITKYLPGYTLDKIEKDNWHPLYVATLKGANDAELQMLIHGFGGQVMHLFPKTTE